MRVLDGRFFTIASLCLFVLILISSNSGANANNTVDNFAPGIDLTQICSPGQSKGCVNWFTKNDFQESYLQLKSKSEKFKNWNKPDAFPLRIYQLYPEREGIGHYTFITYFGYNRSLTDPAVYFSEIGDVFEVYINGNLIKREGRLAASGDKVAYHRTVRGALYRINPFHLKENGLNQLLVKVSGDSAYKHMGLYANQDYKIGSYETLNYTYRDLTGLSLIVLYLFVGAYHLLLWSKRRKETYNLYFGLFCVVLFFYLYIRTKYVFELGIDTFAIRRTELILLAVTGPLMLSFLDDYFAGKFSRFSKGYFIFAGILCVGYIVLPMTLAESPVVPIWQTSILVFGFPYVGYRMFVSVRRKIPDAKRLSVGMVLFFLTVAWDILDASLIHTNITLAKYGFSAFVLGIAFMLANRFLQVHNKMEELNITLEQKVDERTKELNSSLEELQQAYSEVQALKQQQDADYYLTSCLIRPLAKINNDCSSLQLDYILNQKKKFKFRKWDSEIGGDLCVSHTIKLRGRKYLAFVNGDAMGKSLQGAGGALVLGVVFNAMIERTKQPQSIGDRYPEQWLKGTFIELQKIFEAFDGTMLMSAVLGLLEEDTGMLYFINAEHPNVVLYRDRVAAFIDDADNVLTKIGSPVFHGNLVITTIALRPGDVVISGSDGRDDLRIKETGESNGAGQALIDNDEKRFLKIVEKTKGDLEAIQEELSRVGELTDDLSLLRIEYNPISDSINVPRTPEDGIDIRRIKTPSAVSKAEISGRIAELEPELNPDYPDLRIGYELCKLHFIDKNYHRVADLTMLLLDFYPREKELLFIAGVSLKRLGRYNEAADYGERLRLRDPKHLRNLVNLSDVYRLSGKEHRALMILELIEKQDSGNERAAKLKDRLDRQLQRA